MGERRALLIANDAYQNPGLRRLASPGQDVEALGKVLADPQIGGFDVVVLRNEPHHVITRAAAEFFSGGRPDDLLLLHFSGHGLKSTGGDLYLAGVDTSPELLEATAVDARFLNREMDGARAQRVVLLLDCCFGGAFAAGLVARAAEPLTLTDTFARQGGETGRNRVVIAATGRTQFAFEGTDLIDGEPRPSVFTSALVDGLATGEADRGRDGAIDLDELYDYVYDRVRSQGKDQTPTKVVLTATGKVTLAWAPLWRRIAAVRPDGSLPEELGTVRALRGILLGNDVAAAAGAQDALRDLVGSNQRDVGDAARSALDEGQLRAVPAIVDVELDPGDPAPVVTTVRLAGAPLAREFQAITAGRWLRIESARTEDDAVLTVTIDPARAPAPARATITVANRLGELAIAVTARHPAPARQWWPDENRLAWLRQPHILPAAAVPTVALTLINSVPLVRAASALGVLYLLVHVAVLAAGLRLMGGDRRPVGVGLLAAGTSYLLTDALSTLAGQPTAASWFELFAVAAFTVLLGLRLSPFPEVPRWTRRRPLRGRREAGVTLGAAMAYLFLLFVSPGKVYGYATRPMIDLLGLPASLTSVIAMAGFATVLALGQPVRGGQRSFAIAAVAGYLGPEALMLAGSFLLAPKFSYLGSDTYGTGMDATWYAGIQLTVVVILAAAALHTIRRGDPRLDASAPIP